MFSTPYNRALVVVLAHTLAAALATVLLGPNYQITATHAAILFGICTLGVVTVK